MHYICPIPPIANTRNKSRWIGIYSYMHVRINTLHSYIFIVKTRRTFSRRTNSHELSVVTVESSKARPKSRIYLQHWETQPHNQPTNNTTIYLVDWQGITYNYIGNHPPWIVVSWYCLSLHYSYWKAAFLSRYAARVATANYIRQTWKGTVIISYFHCVCC